MKELIVCLDCGDTIVDESTQVFAENGDVLSAEPFPGAVEAIRALHESGYRLALIADGRVASFQNILKGLGLWDLFETHVISETLGVEKPNQRMFATAMRALNLTAADAGRMVMIGNNVARDVCGANEAGMISVLLTRSPRYRMTPFCAEETPDYCTESPAEWPALLERIARARGVG